MADDACIFCQIAGGELPSETVTTDDRVRAFLDVNPLAEGHTLVIPMDHHERLQDCPEAVREALWGTVHELLPALEAAVDADGTNVGVNNGPAAGQEVPHAHVHLIPRFEGDGGSPVHAVAGRRPSLSEADIADIGGAIRDEL